MKIIEKPWGHEKILVECEEYTLKQIYVKPGCRLSLQYHEKKIETMFLVDGEGWLEFQEKDYWYREVINGQSMVRLLPYYIPAYRTHRLCAGKNEGCLVIEISSTYPDDTIRLEDDYGRLKDEAD